MRITATLVIVLRASDDRLRLKIEPEPRYLVTVSGVGYALRPTGEEE